MENYEKKYRHAIEVVKKYSGAHIMLTEDLIGEMFPELIEDNDERLRKQLISIFKSYQNPTLHINPHKWENLNITEIIDWLERQKSLFSDNEKGDVWEYVEKFKENYGHYPKDADEIGVIVSEMVNKHNKPIVFEGKDQGRYEDIRDILRELLNNDKYTRSAIECDLKWLTERFRYMKPQPKQEWSEEDEKLIDYILINCMHYADKCGHVEELNNYEIHQRAKEWLKSLKERYTWKPSEEQMDALEDAIACAVSSIQMNILNSLYQDLKKLKG